MNELNKGWLDILTLLKVEAEKISGEWNGDESGREEDRAHCADEIANAVYDLQELISEMEEL